MNVCLSSWFLIFLTCTINVVWIILMGLIHLTWGMYKVSISCKKWGLLLKSHYVLYIFLHIRFKTSPLIETHKTKCWYIFQFPLHCSRLFENLVRIQPFSLFQRHFSQDIELKVTICVKICRKPTWWRTAQPKWRSRRMIVRSSFVSIISKKK